VPGGGVGWVWDQGEYVESRYRNTVLNEGDELEKARAVWTGRNPVDVAAGVAV